MPRRVDRWQEVGICRRLLGPCGVCMFFIVFSLPFSHHDYEVSMGVQLAYNVVRHTPLTTYAEIDARAIRSDAPGFAVESDAAEREFSGIRVYLVSGPSDHVSQQRWVRTQTIPVGIPQVAALVQVIGYLSWSIRNRRSRCRDVTEVKSQCFSTRVGVAFWSSF